MKIRVYFCKEPDIQPVILKNNKISRQALGTVYDFVWESEFKNLVNVGKIWLKFIEDEKNPFGITLRGKRSHNKIASGDIIQMASDFYIVHKIGVRKLQIND